MFGNERTIGPWKNVPRFVPSSVDEMQEKYKIAKNIHGYSCLREIAKVLHYFLNNFWASLTLSFGIVSWCKYIVGNWHLG